MDSKPEFKLSDPDRIRLIKDSLMLWMKNNNFELYEVRRALAMTLRIDDEDRVTKAMRGDH
jgi:hypothetical protein